MKSLRIIWISRRKVLKNFFLFWCWVVLCAKINLFPRKEEPIYVFFKKKRGKKKSKVPCQFQQSNHQCAKILNEISFGLLFRNSALLKLCNSRENLTASMTPPNCPLHLLSEMEKGN